MRRGAALQRGGQGPDRRIRFSVRRLGVKTAADFCVVVFFFLAFCLSLSLFLRVPVLWLQTETKGKAAFGGLQDKPERDAKRNPQRTRDFKRKPQKLGFN